MNNDLRIVGVCIGPLIALCADALVSIVLCCQEMYLNKQKARATREPEICGRDTGENRVIDLQPSRVAEPIVAAGIPGSGRDVTGGDIIEVIELQPRAGASTQVAQVSAIGDGNATVTYTDGGVYYGNWNNKREGHGKMTWRNGNIYEGGWKDDLQHGRGWMTYSDGSRYNGEWVMGQRHGKGEMNWIDGGPYGGTYYQGDWRNDKKEGRGLLRDRYEGTYNGDWRDDRSEGFGKATWRNGDWYQGGVADGKPEGRGVFYHAASGRAIRGNFRDGDKVTCTVM